MLLASDGVAKLADFGLGALNPSALNEEDPSTLLSQFCGTANCAAPEVLARNDYDGGPADVWSLGQSQSQKTFKDDFATA